MSIKGLNVPTYPSPFQDDETMSVFAVISADGEHGRGEIGTRVITAIFDIYASESAYDAQKPIIEKHSYTITEIFEGTTVNSMDGFFDMLYQVVAGYDPSFAGATIVNQVEEEVE